MNGMSRGVVKNLPEIPIYKSEYGFVKGQRIDFTRFQLFLNTRKPVYVSGKVIKEYEHFILMQMENYRESILKRDIHDGDVIIRGIQ